MTILPLCFYGCKSEKEEFKITDVQFKNNIFKPLYMNYDYGTPICSKQNLEKYRLKRLEQKLRVTIKLSDLKFLTTAIIKSSSLIIKGTENILVME